MTDPSLRGRLLAIMDRKTHAQWPAFTHGGLTRVQLAMHFGQEFGVYVRDFPVLLSRVLGQGPPERVRRALAENIYEEQTGGLSGGIAHPELFLRMIDGLAIARSSVCELPLLAESLAYRHFLDRVSASAPWVVGASVLTIFVEGSVHEREELAGTRVLPSVEEATLSHPMVKHYGCPPAAMGLLRAHRAVESGHRKDAWDMVLTHQEGHAEAIVSAVSEASALWQSYRDAVCRAAGIDAGIA
ncbi:MAG: hypothetical protein NVS3B20_20780 [Polyangiales bacterium]